MGLHARIEPNSASQAMENEKPKKYEDQLMSAFSYDAGDLETNAGGYFSRRQLDRLKAERRRATSIWTLMALLVLMGLIFVVPLFESGLPLSVYRSALSFMISAAVIGVIYGRRAFNISADLNENRVDSIGGRIELVPRALQNVFTYSMKIDTLHFFLKQPMFYALKNGDPYRVFYTPYSKKVLAVEWVNQGDNLRDDRESRADLNVKSADEVTAQQSRPQ